MEKARKRLLKKVPMRKLLASIKKDIRQAFAAAKPKPRKGQATMRESWQKKGLLSSE